LWLTPQPFAVDLFKFKLLQAPHHPRGRGYPANFLSQREAVEGLFGDAELAADLGDGRASLRPA
jgi:hypothetical protein